MTEITHTADPNMDGLLQNIIPSAFQILDVFRICCSNEKMQQCWYFSIYGLL